MIRIKPYTELPHKEEFFNLYLYMAANSMPFYPEDIFIEGYFYPDGKERKDLSAYDRQPIRRTKKYLEKLNEYSVPFGDTKQERQKSDALLAEEIIKMYSEEFHSYLYEDQQDGRVNPERLRSILINPVRHIDLQKLPFLSDALNAKEKYRKDLLNYVFRYETFSNQQGIYRLVNLLGVEVCPYCNRLYITTIVGGDKQIRPQLDHYRNKDKYPFLALSIMNLVPSCGVCNQIKGFDSREIIYPYEDEMGDYCTFEVDAINDITALTGTHFDEDELSILFTKAEAPIPLMERISASIDLLKLDKLYQTHKEYVSLMLLQRYVFSDIMINEIIDSFPELFSSKEDVRALLALGKLDLDNVANHSLGKLTNDITKQLNMLYKAGEAIS